MTGRPDEGGGPPEGAPGPIPRGALPHPEGLESDPPEELPLSDPAHRTARWFMMLAPVLLVVVVFLLLRLSTR